MKVTGMTIHARLQETVVPDDIFNTRYEHRTAYEDIVAACSWRVPAITLPCPDTGDELTVKVPSGTLTGTVLAILQEERDGYILLRMSAAWEGSYGGLMGGMSGVMDWELDGHGGVVLESSATDAPVPLAAYIAAQRAATWNRHYALPEEEEAKALHQAVADRLGVELMFNYHAVHREVLRELIQARHA